MSDEQPIIVSKPSQANTIIAPVFIAAIGVYLWLTPTYPFSWFGITMPVYALWLAYDTRRFSLAIYADRIEIKKLFRKNTDTILLPDITYCAEVHSSRGGYFIRLYTVNQKYVLDPGRFSNYNEIRSQLLPDLEPTPQKSLLERVLVYIIIAVVFISLMITFRRH